ncbi:MAG: NAD(P)/FAD-dependent oxidoreductase [Flavobacteriales bacterium]|nr:NAD(P)/FAD-dependent oxidoreductase [Crocinitomicaceae bacterium]NBX80332.1 NAD(P)/FAD-dependent oxidoreductase [Flavobacteriales bacterium]NCA19543.1 NAD(P)/FAD-dependent oxidoreductase [Crocinitomicaceae bacterium]
MSLNIPSVKVPRVVIIGGGFAGLELANELGNKAFQTVILDRNNHHQFQPLMYQVATAGLEPSSIAFPFRKIFQKFRHFHYRMVSVLKIFPEKKRLLTDNGEIYYDYLVIATGAGNNFFGNANIEKYAMPMKSISEALALRNTIFQRFENALTSEEETEKQANLNFAIVGGGPTGVEIAGALAEMKNAVLPKDYPEMDFTKMRIIIIQGDDRLLSAMSPKSSEKADLYLKELGVEILYNTRVTDYDGASVTFNNHDSIATKTLIWAAGVIGNRIAGLNEAVYGPGGRIFVNEFNQCAAHESIFVIGDVANVQGDELYPNGHPQMAQPAIQQGKLLAKNLVRLQNNEAMKPFKYKNLGNMATIGRNKAVVELPNSKFQGFFAWLVWLVVHLRSIIGVKNRFIILLNWIWNYFTYNLSLRLIIRSKDKSL